MVHAEPLLELLHCSYRCIFMSAGGIGSLSVALCEACKPLVSHLLQLHGDDLTCMASLHQCGIYVSLPKGVKHESSRLS